MNSRRLVQAVLFVSCILSVVSRAALEKHDKLRWRHADAMKRQLIDGQVETSLQGNVLLVQGGTTIKCDLSTNIIGQDVYTLIGHVEIADEKQTLHADTVYFYQTEQKQVASGNVISITEKDTTFADRITYFQEMNRIIAEGDVRIVNPEERTLLTGGRAEYWRNTDFGKISEQPILTEFDTLGVETTRVEADTMEIYEGGERTVARNGVTIVQPKSTATCEQAEYLKGDGKFVLHGDPNVVLKRQEIKGDTLTLYLVDSQLRKAVVKGHALATSDADTLHKGKRLNRLTGQAMDFYFKESELHEVVIEGQATSLYHVMDESEYKGKNEVSGDRIIVTMGDGSVKRVVVNSSPDISSGKFSPAENRDVK